MPIQTPEYALLLNLLISARKTKAIRQQDLASRLGKPQSFVSKYERGERRLDVIEFVAVCRALHVDPHSILDSLDDAAARRASDTPD
ncbi:MAG: helix-turn-helix transcriptional regulator [Acidobacteria bacterium]|nr:helix-turn-helix transcriptional regulator [Acidobacteriota bacterium]MYI40130.1 helix-turn-helix transcriptional regulator [Acidobacteriota bacterium]